MISTPRKRSPRCSTWHGQSTERGERVSLPDAIEPARVTLVELAGVLGLDLEADAAARRG